VYSIIVPTLNAARDWPCFAPPLLAVCVTPSSLSRRFGIDRRHARAGARGRVSSLDRTALGVNHGGNSFRGRCENPSISHEDATLADQDSVWKLIVAFQDPEVATAYGRQLPRPGAGSRRTPGSTITCNLECAGSDEPGKARYQGFLHFELTCSLTAVCADGGSGISYQRDYQRRRHRRGWASFALGYKVAYVAVAHVYQSHGYSWAQDEARGDE
jgi:rhamnosyltransferase